MQLVMPIQKMLSGQEIGAKAKAARGRLIKKVGLFILVIVISALFCVWSRVGIVQLGYETSKLQEEAGALHKRSSHLQLEVERLKSPSHLQKVAEEILGMYPPKSEETIFVKKKDQGSK